MGILGDDLNERSKETLDILNQALVDRYRCCDNVFDFVLAGKLSDDEGYFRFGSSVTCYGRSSSGRRESQVESDLYDTFKDVVMRDSRLEVPFSATEVIDNLRLERYANKRGSQNGCEKTFRKLYYFLRPFTTLSVRRQVQRFYAAGWTKRAFPQWPVDTTVEKFCEELLLLSMRAKGLDRVPFVWFWPEGARGCVIITHDVETEDGRDFCADLMDVDDAHGIKASFQIVPEGRYPISPVFADLARQKGFDVGIQDLNHDGRLFDDRNRFLRRAATINRYASQYSAKGFRAAVLYRQPEWYDALNFSFDMSIPNVAHLDPQRGGCCTVMPYFIGNMLELPVTTTQDYTLFHILNERSGSLWEAQLDLILARNGLASFIIHPDYVMQRDTMSAYEDLLAFLQRLRAENPVWFALPAEVDIWWRARSRMTVVNDEGSWRIEGEGSERAALAYAKNVDGKLVYEVANAAVVI